MRWARRSKEWNKNYKNRRYEYATVINSLWSNFFHHKDPWYEAVAAMWAATPLFKHIPQSEIRMLSSNMHRRTFQPDEAIFKCNDLGAGAAMIVSGKVEIRAADVVLAVLGAGDFFGEVSLVLDERRTADAIAVAESELAFFLRIDLDEWIARAPKHGARLSKNLAHTLAKRLQQSNQLLGEHKIA